MKGTLSLVKTKLTKLTDFHRQKYFIAQTLLSQQFAKQLGTSCCFNQLNQSIIQSHLDKSIHLIDIFAITRTFLDKNIYKHRNNLNVNKNIISNKLVFDLSISS